MTLVYSWARDLDVLPGDAGKAAAARFLADSWGVPAEHVIAAGDSGNDAALLTAGLDLEHLTAADITAFVVARCPHQAHGSAKLTVTALRALLGFLHVDGVLPRSSAAGVPQVASWRLAGLPRALEPPPRPRCSAPVPRSARSDRSSATVVR